MMPILMANNTRHVTINDHLDRGWGLSCGSRAGVYHQCKHRSCDTGALLTTCCVLAIMVGGDDPWPTDANGLKR